MRTLFLTCALAVLVGGQAATATIIIHSDGSDGSLVISNDTLIDLSLAVSNRWDANNSANAGKGIYDAQKWAVVFKYSSVTINGGATVTFTNHPSCAPVVWLVSGNVQIDGTVSLDGQNLALTPRLSEPGPGGFRGGMGYFGYGADLGAGFGPSGGRGWAGNWIDAGSYGSPGYHSDSNNGPLLYGNPSLIPLIGGSGGCGGYYFGANDPSHNVDRSGGAGGGAILIATASTLSLNGQIHCIGGTGSHRSGAGSGGGIRLVAETLSGVGELNAAGGLSPEGYNGGLGRIRIETVNTNTTLVPPIPDPSVLKLASDAAPPIWMPDGGPAVIIESISGQLAPLDPRAGFGAVGADIVLPQITNTIVKVVTTNVEPASVVLVRVIPRANASFTQTSAILDTVLSADPQVIRWTANVPVNNGYSAMQVHVVRP